MKNLKSISLIGAIFLSISILPIIIFLGKNSVLAETDSIQSFPSPYVLSEQKVSIDRDPDAHRYRPQVAYNYNHNEYLVVWHNTWDNGFRRPFARRLDINGNPIGDPFELTNVAVNQVHPFVVYNGTDDVYFVVWMYDVSTSGTRYEIWGSIIPWNATTYGTSFRIGDWSSPNNMWYPSAAWNSLHNEYLVIWDTYNEGGTTSPLNIGYRRVASDGTPGTAGTITIANAPNESDIVYNMLVDEYVVVWTRRIDDVSTGHYVQGALLNWDATINDIDFILFGEEDDQKNPAVATNQQYFAVAFQYWAESIGQWISVARLINLSGGFVFDRPCPWYSCYNPDIVALEGNENWLFLYEGQTTSGTTVIADIFSYPWTYPYYYVLLKENWLYRIPAGADGGSGLLFTYTLREDDASSWQHIYATKIWPYAIFFPLIFK